MVSSRKSEVFPRLYSSQAVAFVRMNHHKFRVLLDKANSLALMWDNIVADGAEMELRFKSLAECPKALFQCKVDVPGMRFPF